MSANTWWILTSNFVEPSGTTSAPSTAVSAPLVKVGHISLRTGQLVVAMETSTAPENAGALLAVQGIDSDVVAEWNEGESSLCRHLRHYACLCDVFMYIFIDYYFGYIYGNIHLLCYKLIKYSDIIVSVIIHGKIVCLLMTFWNDSF